MLLNYHCICFVIFCFWYVILSNRVVICLVSDYYWFMVVLICQWTTDWLIVLLNDFFALLFCVIDNEMVYFLFLMVKFAFSLTCCVLQHLTCFVLHGWQLIDWLTELLTKVVDFCSAFSFCSAITVNWQMFKWSIVFC